MANLILGTVQFGLDYGINNSHGKPSPGLVKSVLDFAFENKIVELDTADAYGDAQFVLRNYLSKSPYKFQIMSKFIWDKKLDFNQQLNHTLSVLSLNSLLGYYFHRFEDFKVYPYFEQIRQCIKENKLKYLGVSIYSLEELEFAIDHPEINLIQLPFNLFDRSLKKQELLIKAKAKGIKVYIRSVFLQGLFFKDINNLPAKLIPLRDCLFQLSNLSKEYSISIEELAIGYINAKEFIDGALIGVDSVQQLSNNLKYSKTKLSGDLIKKIESIEIVEVGLLNPANWNQS